MRRILTVILMVVLTSTLIVSQSEVNVNNKIFKAVETGSLEQVKELVEKGADVNAEDENKATPVMWAAYKGHMDILKYLVSKGADPKKKGIIWVDKKKKEFYGSSIACAVAEGRLDMLKYLIEKSKLNVDDRELELDGTETGGTALIGAAYKGKMDIVKYLISKGANINAVDKDGYTAIFNALTAGFEDIAQFLSHNGAIISQKDKNIARSLFFFIEGGNALKNGEYEKAINNFQKTRELNPEFIPLKAKKSVVTQGIGLAHYNLAKELEKKYEYEKSVDHFKKAYTIFKNDKKKAYGILQRIGNGCYFLNRYEQAIEYYKKLLKIGKEIINSVYLVTTYNNMGMSYKQLHQFDKAIKWFNKAVEFHKCFPENKKDKNYKAAEQTTYTGLGQLYEELYKYDKALNYQEKALKAFKEIGNRQGEELVLMAIARIYTALSRFQDGIKNYEQALAISIERGDPSSQAFIFNNMGDVYEKTNQFKKAEDYYAKALIVSKVVNNLSLEGTILNNLGIVYSDLSQNQKALECYHKALAINKKLDDRQGIGNTLSNMGVVYISQRKYKQALKCLERALMNMRKIKYRKGEATALNNIGNLNMFLSRFEKAEEYLLEAKEIDIDIRNLPGEKNTYINLGRLYKNLGQYEKAIGCFNRALKIAQNIGDALGEGTIYDDLGTIYSSIGLNDEAKKYFNKALEIIDEIGVKETRSHILNNLGIVHYMLKDDRKALEFFNQSLNITAEDINDPLDGGRTNGNLGLIYLESKQYDEALIQFTQALKAARTFKDEIGEATALYNLSKLSQKQEQFQNAFDYGKKSELIYKETGARDDEADAKINLANIYLKMGRKKKAVKKLEEALKIKNRIRFDFDFKREKMKLSFFEDCLEPYKTLFNLYMEAGKYRKAFETAEASKSVVFAEMMAKKKSYLKYANLKRDFLYPTHVNIKTLQDLLKEDEAYISYYFLEDKAIAFIITRNQFNYITLDLNKVIIEETIQEMRNQVSVSLEVMNTVFNNKKRRFSQLHKIYSNYPHVSNRLYQKLFKPLESFVKDKKLLISAEGVLYGFPLEALVTQIPENFHHNGKKYSLEKLVLKEWDGKIPLFHEFSQMKYLEEKYNISYIPTASVLKVLRQNLKRKRPWVKGVIAFADPVFLLNEEVESKVKAKDSKTKIIIVPIFYVKLGVIKSWPLKRMPETAIEAETFKNAVGYGEVYTGLNATEENVWKAGLEKAKYILFSTHGILPKEVSSVKTINISEPALALTLINNPHEYDGLLEMSEAARLELNSDIVILSSCSSAGKSGKGGEGFAGMARSFIFAGSQAVVASHWPVEVQATKMLIENYGKYLKTKGRLEALETARNMVKNAVVEYGKENKIKVSYGHPYFWAAFVLLGEK